MVKCNIYLVFGMALVYLCASLFSNVSHKMEIYVVTKDNKVQGRGFVSLAALCTEYRLDYSSASKGKRVWIEGDSITVVSSVIVEKIKGRGGAFKPKGV